MFHLILGVHLVLCVVLVVLVLLQQGKGANMGAAFGGSNSQTLFGAGGAATLLTKVTTAMAVCFMVTSILLVRHYTDAVTVGGSEVRDPLADSVMNKVAESDAPPAAVPNPVEQNAVAPVPDAGSSSSSEPEKK